MNISKMKGWLPVLELEPIQAQKNERYWVFGVTDNQVRCLPLRV